MKQLWTRKGRRVMVGVWGWGKVVGGGWGGGREGGRGKERREERERVCNVGHGPRDTARGEKTEESSEITEK